MIVPLCGWCGDCDRLLPVVPGMRHLLVAHVADRTREACPGGRAGGLVHPAHAMQAQHQIWGDDSVWELGDAS